MGSASGALGSTGSLTRAFGNLHPRPRATVQVVSSRADHTRMRITGSVQCTAFCGSRLGMQAAHSGSSSSLTRGRGSFRDFSGKSPRSTVVRHVGNVGNVGGAASWEGPTGNDGKASSSDLPPPPTDNGGEGDNGDDNSDAYAGILMAAGRTIDTLPVDIASAIKSSSLPPNMLSRYLDLSKNPVVLWLLQFPGFRERLMGDPGFLLKLGIELGIGICTKSAAEYAKRGDKFESQLDFVAANIMMALAADFMLVWLPAPTYALRGTGGASAGGNGLMKKVSSVFDVFKGCPDNAFQRVPAGYAPFTLTQRVGAVVRNGLKLFGVGFGASMMGVAVTNGLVAARCMLDPSFVPLNAPQDVAVMSGAYGLYMATSSNLRYQIMAGVLEERIIETLFKGNPAVCGALSFAVRTGNTFLGSLLWVDFIRLLRLQD